LIGLLGAPGPTGQLVEAELDERGVPYHAGPELDGVDLVLNVAGPFTPAGLAVVRAAVERGAGYVDGCRDPAFTDRVYDTFGAAPALVVPGCAPEQVIGDLAAAIAVGGLPSGVTDELVVTYDFGGAVPRFARPPRWARRRQVRFPGEAEAGVEVQSGVEVQWGERVRVPRWLPGARVTTVIAVSGQAATALQVAGVLDPVSRYLPSPVPRVPRQEEFRVMAEARGGRHRAAVVVEASGGPRLAARVLIEAAMQAGGAGALTPAQALDPEPFLRALSSDDLTWQRVDARP
jgi:short subunit dehydrogenase-like uncharacterized protein